MLLLELPLTEYREALRIQDAIVERKILRGGADVLMLLEHPPTVTLGKRGLETHLLISKDELKSRKIAFHSVDRGGGATFHGPGQLVCYPIIDLKAHEISVREYVNRLEETIISTLKGFGLQGFRQEGKVGVWTDKTEKIASIGVRIRRRVAFHGFSINVDMQIEPDELIISCDLPDARLVNLRDYTDSTVTMDAVKEETARSFRSVFEVDLERCSIDRAIA